MKRIVVVGVGALGSHFVLFGRNLQADLHIIDFDKIESKNIQSQFHTYMGRGKSKVYSLSSAMWSLFKVNVTYSSVRLLSNNVDALIKNSDLVVDCTDNIETRLLIQKYCLNNGIDCLHGCLSADGKMGRIAWTEHFRPDDTSRNVSETCIDGENLPFYVVVASSMVEVIKVYLNENKKLDYHLVPLKYIPLF